MSTVAITIRDMAITDIADAAGLSGIQVIPFSSRLEVTKGLSVVVGVSEPAVELHDALGAATELRYALEVHIVWSADYERSKPDTPYTVQAAVEKALRAISRTDIDAVLPAGLQCTLLHRIDGDDTTDGSMQRRTITYDVYVIGEETEVEEE